MAVHEHQAASELGPVDRMSSSHIDPLRQPFLLEIAMNWTTHAVLADSLARVQGATTFNGLSQQHHRETIDRRTALKIDVVASKSICRCVALLAAAADATMMSASLDEERTILAQAYTNLPAAHRLIEAVRPVAVEHLM
jgi:hypothetical protein